jgi:hypothetical protein
VKTAKTASRGTIRLIVLLVAAALSAVGLVGVAVPASAQVFVTLSVNAGTVGVTQKVSATVSTDAIGSPSGTVVFTANGTAIGSEQVGGSLGSTAQLAWTPRNSGSVSVQAQFDPDTGDSAFDSKTVQIARVNTATSISTPGTAATSSVIPLTATVRSTQGAYIPTGSVTFFLSTGAAIGSSALDGNGRSSVNYTTPATLGNVTVYAVYNGDLNANSSKSSNDTIKVSAAKSTVQLVVPQTNYVNTSVQLTAKITPTNATGTVDFSVNGQYLGTGKVANGVATLTWVPAALGSFVLTAKYSGGNGVNPGSASNTVKVIQQLKTDVITVDPAGSAGPWVPGTVTATLTNGTSVTLNASSASGSNIALSVVGPCSFSANVLKVNGVGGPCTVTAKTNGGNGYAPVTQTYTVQTAAGKQTAKVPAPGSGVYGRGSRLKLSKTNAKTNVGQPISWKVTSGRSHCKVVVSGSYYKLKLVNRGTCKVKGSAPAISNQWSAYSTKRTYSVV